jgi:hypothetical protein
MGSFTHLVRRRPAATNANHAVRPSDSRLACTLPTGIVTEANETNALVYVATSKLPPALSLPRVTFVPGTSC